jgi:hypothetical protein
MDINSLVGTIETSSVIGAFALLLYFSVDIYLVLTRRDFGNVNIQVMYFTRNDNDESKKTRNKNKGLYEDALLFRHLDSKISLRELYKNRFLFWAMIYSSRNATLEYPVLNFGKYSEALLAPLRGRVLTICASDELKRIAGWPFKQTRYQMLVIYDRAEKRGSYTLRVVLVRQKDLNRFMTYLKHRPPKIQTNLPLFKKIATAYKHKLGSFMQVNIVTT